MDLQLEQIFSTFGGRLKWARERARLTQEQLCLIVSMSQGAYSKLERGGSGSEKTSSIAKAVNVDPFWLETGQGTPDPQEAPADDFIQVRSAELRLSAGIAGVQIDYLHAEAPPLWFRADWIREKGYNPKRLLCTKVKGRSMEKSLFDGDTVVVNLADTEPKDEMVYAFNFEGEPVVKRLIRDLGQWWLSSDNEDQGRYPRKAATNLSLIIGKIIAKQSTII